MKVTKIIALALILTIALTAIASCNQVTEDVFEIAQAAEAEPLAAPGLIYNPTLTNSVNSNGSMPDYIPTYADFAHYPAPPTLILAEEDLIFEQDKYILHIPKGGIYSTITLELFDKSVDLIEEFTDLQFLTNEFPNKVMVYTTNGNVHSYAAGTEAIYICGESEFASNDFIMEIAFAHEMAHVLYFRHFNETHFLPVFIEGFAELIAELVNSFNGVAISSAAYQRGIYEMISFDGGNVWVNQIDTLNNIITNNLATFLRTYQSGDIHGETSTNIYTIGYLFMRYLYEEFGMDVVTDIIKNVYQSRSTYNIPDIISDTVDRNITVNFPKWYYENENVYINVNTFSSNLRFELDSLKLTGRYNPMPFLWSDLLISESSFHLQAIITEPVLIDFREGMRKAELQERHFIPHLFYVITEDFVSIHFYNYDDELLGSVIYAGAYTWSEDDDLYRNFANETDIAYVVLIPVGEAEFSLTYADSISYRNMLLYGTVTPEDSFLLQKPRTSGLN